MVGDCTLAEAKTRRGWGTALQTVVGKNYDYPFAKTVQYFEKDYLTIANLECNLSDKYYDSIEQFVFLAPADYANILTAGSVEFVSPYTRSASGVSARRTFSISMSMRPVISPCVPPAMPRL